MATTGSPDLKRTARLFHALSDETRLRIIARLRGGERCVCELMDAVDAAQSRLSFHLKALKDAGIVNDRREGRWNYYSIAPDAREALIGALVLLEARSSAHQDAVCC
ncbi:MAG TPA: metalloregulator ArsR/SmtB family transcription factor [Gemmatimonadales bacterium]|nr:metalloregulator ArsR/SmtB family transcription factor [Gemmatimonadales bacterium]